MQKVVASYKFHNRLALRCLPWMFSFMLAHVDPFEGNLWESYKMWQRDSVSLTNKRLFSCRAKTKYFFKRMFTITLAAARAASTMLAGSPTNVNTVRLVDQMGKFSLMPLRKVFTSFTQFSRKWTRTWPGSTSSKVAPWVARTAAAMASITCREEKKIILVGTHTLKVTMTQCLWLQNKIFTGQSNECWRFRNVCIQKMITSVSTPSEKLGTHSIILTILSSYFTYVLS